MCTTIRSNSHIVDFGSSTNITLNPYDFLN